MKFSLIHPTRSRPDKSAATISKWISRCDDYWNNLEVIISRDKDDESKYDYKFASAWTKLITVIESENKSAVDAINEGAKLATGDIFIVVSDDTDCPMHWDKILLDAIGQSKDFVMKTDDGIQKRIITMPIMDRIYYNRDGHIYDPEFSHSWCDTFLTEKAHKRGRVITRMDIKFPHNHYSVTGEQPDELYKRNDLTHDRDRHIFQAKMKTL